MKIHGVRLGGLFAIVAVTLAAPGLARAEDPPPPRALVSATTSEPYALQVVLADLASVAMLLVPLPPFSAMAVASYVITPPIIHLLHDRPARAAGSLGLRLLLPVAGGALGFMAESCDSDSDSLCGLGGLALGGLLGIVTASIVDAAVLAGAPPEASGARTERRPLARLAGIEVDQVGVAPQRNGGGLILGGRF